MSLRVRGAAPFLVAFPKPGVGGSNPPGRATLGRANGITPDLRLPGPLNPPARAPQPRFEQTSRLGDPAWNALSATRIVTP